MLAAHLALATLTVAPASQTAALPPLALADGALSSAPKAIAVTTFRIRDPLPRVALSGADGEPIASAVDAAPALAPAASTALATIALAAAASPSPVPDPAPSPRSVDLAAPRRFPDPLEPLNRISYAISQPVDRFVIRPAAMIYKTVIPKPARDGARNAIANFGEPIVFVNDLLQLRPDRAVKTLGRFLINSVLGVGGLFDIAKRKPFHIPHHNNGFADTLGYLGIGPIVYVYVPILGPTSFRDMAGQYGDSYFSDRNLHKLLHPNASFPYFRTQPKLGKSGKIITLIDGLNQRVEHDNDLRTFKEDSVDPYAAMRAAYLQDRAGEIAELRAKNGEAPKTDAFDDPLVDPAGKTSAPTVDNPPAPEPPAKP